MHLLSTRSILTAAMLMASGLSSAQANNLFKCTEPNGQVVYSDRACTSEPPKPSANAAPTAPGKGTSGFSNAAVKGKITEAAIAAILKQAIDLGTRGDYRGQCALAAPDISFSITDPSTRPPQTVSGKRKELCELQRASAHTLASNGLRASVQQSGVQIKISADGTQATAKHTHTTTVKEDGDVVMVQTCQQEDAFGIYDGKILYNSVRSVCKQIS
jgi:hypothetical protein